MLAAYCIGIVFRDRLKWMLWAVLFSYVVLVIYCIRKYGWMQRARKACFGGLILTVLFLLGAILGNLQDKDYPLDAELTEKTFAQAEGRIRSITETKSGYRMILNHVVLKDFDSKGKLLVYCESADGLQIGNTIRLAGELAPFSEPENPGQLDEKSYYRAQRIACKFYPDEIEVIQDGVDRIREWCRKIREWLDDTYEEILPAEHAGIVSAILLGDKADLSEDTKSLYQKNGIAHILAISGLHVSLLGMGLFALIRKAGSPLIPAAAVTALILVFYGSLTEFGISTQRAVGMLIIAMLAKILGRSYDSRSACALCGFVVLLVNPMQLYQTGFQLSFAAAFGISYFGREWELMKLQKGKTSAGKCLLLFLSGPTPQLITAPIILNTYYELPVYSVFLNIPVVGLLSSVVFLSILAGIAGLFSVTAGRFLAGGVYWILELYECLCKLTERLSFPVWLYGKPQDWRLAAYFAVVVLFFVVAGQIAKKFRHHPRQHGYRRYALCVLCLLPLVFLRLPDEESVRNEPDSSCVVDFLSVGQGDCAVVRTASDKAYLIDCGSTTVKSVGEYRLKPWLKYQGIAVLEAVFLSHPDSDHTNGVMELLEQTNSTFDWYQGEIQIRNLVLPAAFREETEEGIRLMENGDNPSVKNSGTGFAAICKLALEKEIPVFWFVPGDTVTENEVVFTCLHPDVSYPTHDTNDASLTLLLECGNTAIVFAGDIGENAEACVAPALRKKMMHKETVILKTAHHGSKYSTSKAFLEVLQPQLAVVSYGKDNRFGHPHVETLERLQNAGSKIALIPEYGTVTVCIGNEKTEVSGYR